MFARFDQIITDMKNQKFVQIIVLFNFGSILCAEIPKKTTLMIAKLKFVSK
jgi:hypothetical protein